uniref:Pectinesterase inhibitor domain-containing protein n=1 Tax=Fagus sylvatica TaxID=28930 RepID=A0A2N9J9M3_FAGSY
MASPISCISIFLLPLIATSLFFQVSNATFEVKADQALIDSICEQTQDVDFCKSTFNANPRTPAADRDGLVVLSIAINIDVVQATINDTIPEIVKTLIDPIDKQRIQVCLTDYNDALVTLIAAFTASSEKNYKEVIGLVTDAANKIVDCDGAYRKSPPIREPPISGENDKVTKLTDITYVIIDLI